MDEAEVPPVENENGLTPSDVDPAPKLKPVAPAPLSTAEPPKMDVPVEEADVDEDGGFLVEPNEKRDAPAEVVVELPEAPVVAATNENELVSAGLGGSVKDKHQVYNQADSEQFRNTQKSVSTGSEKTGKHGW